MLTKELARPKTNSRLDDAAPDEVENLNDFAEVWKAKGLEGGAQ